MEEDANIDSKFSTWTVGDSPLYYVNHKDLDLVCCKGGIHQVVVGEENYANELSDSEDDIFKASDVLDNCGFKNIELRECKLESKVVFKYKKPAIAFDSFVTDENELIIFSLHAKRTLNSSQHKTTIGGSTLFYVEITTCEETIFKCIHPCAAAVEIKSTETPENREGWILAVKADRITSEFVNEMIGQVQRNSFDLDGYAIFAHISDDPDHVYVAYLKPGLDILGEKVFARVQYRQKISTKPFFLFDANIFKFSSQNSSSDLYLNDEAGHALSLLLAMSRDAENSSISFRDLRDIKLSQGTVFTLDSEGAVWCYSCSENNLIKKKASVFGVAFMSLGESRLSLITKTGSLYRLQLPLQDRVSDDLYKCDARVDDIVEASEVLKKLSKEKDETELILNQLKFLLRMEKGSEKFPFEVSFRVAESNLELNRTTFQLILDFKAVKESTELSDSFLAGKYWHLLVRFLPSSDQTQYHEAIALPSSLDWSAQSWTCHVSIPEACLRLSKLPIEVKLSVCLSINDVSVPSASFHQFQLRSLDFLTVRSFTRNACLVKAVNSRDLSTENDTFETFLQKMNKTRPIFNMATAELGNTSEKVPSFEVKLEKSLITSSKTLQLFEKLNELFLDSGSDELRNVCFSTTLFDAEVSVVLQESSPDDIILSFCSRDFEGLRQLKAETSLFSFRGISFSKKSYVEVPSSVVSRVVDLKHLVKNSNLSSETLKLCHDYLRCQLSSQLP